MTYGEVMDTLKGLVPSNEDGTQDTKVLEALAIVEAAISAANDPHGKCEFKFYAERMISAPNCNTCTNAQCSLRPAQGQMARINCALWVGQMPGQMQAAKPEAQSDAGGTEPPVQSGT